jgi:hypothetical protein
MLIYMGHSKKVTGLLLLIAMVGVGAVLYFGFFKAQPAQTADADVNKTPTSRAPAKEHILGADAAPVSLNDFMKTEYDRQNAECKKQNPKTELAMGVVKAVRDTYASVSLGCGENGMTGYYAKINNVWQFVFKSDDTPACSDVNRVQFTKEIIPECMSGTDTADNPNP